MTTSNDDQTMQLPEFDATTPLPTIPDAVPDATVEMPTSDPLAVFRDEPNTQILMANPLGLEITALPRVHHHSKDPGYRRSRAAEPLPRFPDASPGDSPLFPLTIK